MKKIIVNDISFEIIENYRDAIESDALKDNLTEYFIDYDYILGDWSAGRLRLKGFCDKNNPKYKKINDYDSINTYIQENCAYGCKYFILRKILRKKD